MTSTSRPLPLLALLVLAVATAFTTTGCRKSVLRPSGPLVPMEYYTKYPMHLKGDMLASTNYRGGGGSVLLPVNTKVNLIGGSGRRCQLVLDGSRQIRWDHRERDTQDTLEDAFLSAFAMSPVDTSSLDADTQAALATGEPAIGMSKELVLMVMGPPPARGTLSLDANRWKYWEHGWNRTFDVVFDNDGFVTQITR